jgi:ParB family chromosome partitioning protein
VRNALLEGKLREGQARPLVNLDPAVIEEILPQILSEEWSARKIEQFIVQLKKHGMAEKARPVKQAAQTPYEADIDRLAKRLSAKVAIKTNSKGAGQIVIRFGSDDEFQRIQQLLGNAS